MGSSLQPLTSRQWDHRKSTHEEGDSLPSIAVFGSYNGSSIGDSLILLGLISSLSRVLPSGARICVYHFNHSSPLNDRDLKALALDREIIIKFKTVSPATWKGYAGRWLIKSMPIAHRLRLKLLARLLIRLERIEEDHLIVGGGNLVMDLFEVWPFCLKRVIDACKAQGRPYSLLGIGAGPIGSVYAATIFRRILDTAHAVELRDQQSLELCRLQLNYDGGRVMPDPALATHIHEQLLPRRPIKTQLGINVAGVWGHGWPYTNQSRYRDMLRAYSALVSRLCQQYAYTNIVFIVSNLADVKAAHDLAELTKIASPSVNLDYSDYKSLSPIKLLEAVSACNFIVTTRLHACLASGMTGRNFMAFSYQHKVANVLGSYSAEHAIWDLEDFIDNPVAAIERTLQQASLSSKSDRLPFVSRTSSKVDLAVQRVLDASLSARPRPDLPSTC